ncbi:hypothetical protein, conserved in T. vivax [Trypanosoma vivax Y486]|uniref:Uncharacterized protein n=1 Tax=Trypanosoma vivax (strain Y486) TaxID=1055687 RepID=F9WLL5_TRYVY|nr:hypothetical protein, conserved in T. vivax [Trypanosoma vivax Y486]|eukprot:CCD18407.1 hypothetical protein, conserved in T. vivax [Trypanosoma vivax Y486]
MFCPTNVALPRSAMPFPHCCTHAALPPRLARMWYAGLAYAHFATKLRCRRSAAHTRLPSPVALGRQRQMRAAKVWSFVRSQGRARRVFERVGPLAVVRVFRGEGRQVRSVRVPKRSRHAAAMHLPRSLSPFPTSASRRPCACGARNGSSCAVIPVDHLLCVDQLPHWPETKADAHPRARRGAQRGQRAHSLPKGCARSAGRFPHSQLAPARLPTRLPPSVRVSAQGGRQHVAGSSAAARARQADWWATRGKRHGGGAASSSGKCLGQSGAQRMSRRKGRRTARRHARAYQVRGRRRSTSMGAREGWGGAVVSVAATEVARAQGIA